MEDSMFGVETSFPPTPPRLNHIACMHALNTYNTYIDSSFITVIIVLTCGDYRVSEGSEIEQEWFHPFHHLNSSAVAKDLENPVLDEVYVTYKKSTFTIRESTIFFFTPKKTVTVAKQLT